MNSYFKRCYRPTPATLIKIGPHKRGFANFPNSISEDTSRRMLLTCYSEQVNSGAKRNSPRGPSP